MTREISISKMLNTPDPVFEVEGVAWQTQTIYKDGRLRLTRDTKPRFSCPVNVDDAGLYHLDRDNVEWFDKATEEEKQIILDFYDVSDDLKFAFDQSNPKKRDGQATQEPATAGTMSPEGTNAASCPADGMAAPTHEEPTNAPSWGTSDDGNPASSRAGDDNPPSDSTASRPLDGMAAPDHEGNAPVGDNPQATQEPATEKKQKK